MLKGQTAIAPLSGVRQAPSSVDILGYPEGFDALLKRFSGPPNFPRELSESLSGQRTDSEVQKKNNRYISDYDLIKEFFNDF